jgi:hypothetical protein
MRTGAKGIRPAVGLGTGVASCLFPNAGFDSRMPFNIPLIVIW